MNIFQTKILCVGFRPTFPWIFFIVWYVKEFVYLKRIFSATIGPKFIIKALKYVKLFSIIQK